MGGSAAAKRKNMPKTKKIYNYPLVALRGKVIFPATEAVFDAGRLKSLTAISNASSREMTLFVCMQKDAAKDEITPDDVCTVGTVVRIKQIAKLSTGNLRVTVEGLFCAKAEEVYEEESCFFANVAEGDLFFLRHGGGFARRAEDDQHVRAVFDLEIDHPAEGFKIYFSVFRKRRDHRRCGTVEEI